MRSHDARELAARVALRTRWGERIMSTKASAANRVFQIAFAVLFGLTFLWLLVAGKSGTDTAAPATAVSGKADAVSAPPVNVIPKTTTIGRGKATICATT